MVPTAAELGALAGRYEGTDLSATFHVTGERGVRSTWTAGKEAMPVTPVTRDVFRVVRIESRFLRDDAGHVAAIDHGNPVLGGSGSPAWTAA